MRSWRTSRTSSCFLGSLWGLLAGISVFFPLSNTLLGVIPMKAYGADGVFDQLSPALIYTVFFSLLTRAFVLIGMLEFFGNSDRA
jgi:hypothetical protein